MPALWSAGGGRSDLRVSVAWRSPFPGQGGVEIAPLFASPSQTRRGRRSRSSSRSPSALLPPPPSRPPVPALSLPPSPPSPSEGAPPPSARPGDPVTRPPSSRSPLPRPSVYGAADRPGARPPRRQFLSPSDQRFDH
ncbi:unnamed protein product [Caretta caretta]